MRFALPFHAEVAVVTQGRKELLDLEGRRTWDLGNQSSNSAGQTGLVSRIEAARHEGAQFLLVPALPKTMLDRDSDLQECLHQWRVVLDDKDCCTIFAVERPHATSLPPEEGPDGLPLPPPEMIALSTGAYDWRSYYDSGLAVAQDLSKFLSRTGCDLDRFESMVDFGCGSGRVLRHWKGLKRVTGVDYNPYLVSWCRENLKFASFEVSTGERLPFAENSVDFIFSFSVFTHLDATAERFWMEELTRVLSTGGCMVVTTAGSAYIDDMNPEERRHFESGEPVIRSGHLSGSSACFVMHPAQYLRNVLAPGLEVLDFAPGAIQLLDGLLLKKALSSR